MSSTKMTDTITVPVICDEKEYQVGLHPPASWSYALLFQIDLLSVKRKESFAELSYGFQYPVGKRCLGYLRQTHYESLESRKAELEELILTIAAPYQQELAILQTAPGISGDFTAIGIISEIGTNMEDFPSAKHLCSWAGLTPAG